MELLKKAKALLRRKPKQFTVYTKPVEVKEVFVDSSGVQYYELVHITQMSHARAVAAEIATRHVELTLTKEALHKLIDKMREYANSGDITSLFSLINEMEVRLDYAGEEETLLGLASVYFFEKGEDLDVYAQSWQQRKIERWKKDPKAKDFFLCEAYKRTKGLTNTSEDAILNSLQEMKRISPMIRSILASTSTSL